MAIFTDPERDHPLDWMILQVSPVALYFAPAVLEGDIRWLADRQYVVYSFDCGEWRSDRMFHDAAADVLRFPPYYGRNLDAFDDCLSDLDIPDEGGAALVFHRFDAFAERRKRTAQAILDIVAVQSRIFSLLGRRLLALVQSSRPDVGFETVGACPVAWNPKEATNASRVLQH
jgi:RNAse (barnase) inhibitor barstar